MRIGKARRGEADWRCSRQLSCSVKNATTMPVTLAMLATRQVDLGAEDDEGQPDRDDRR